MPPPRKKVKNDNDYDDYGRGVNNNIENKITIIDSNLLVERKIKHFKYVEYDEKSKKLCDYSKLSRLYYSSKNKFSHPKMKLYNLFEQRSTTISAAGGYNNRDNNNKDKLGELDRLENYDNLRQIIRNPILIQYQNDQITKYKSFLSSSFSSSSFSSFEKDKDELEKRKEKEKEKLQQEPESKSKKSKKKIIGELFNWKYILSPFYETIQPIVYQGRQYATEEHAINAQKFSHDIEFQFKFSLDDKTSTFNRGYQVKTAHSIAKTKITISKHRQKQQEQQQQQSDFTDFLISDNTNNFNIEDSIDDYDIAATTITTKFIHHHNKFSCDENNDYHERTSLFHCPEFLTKHMLPIQSNKIVYDILYAKYTCDPIAKMVLLATNQALLFNEDYLTRRSKDHNNIIECIPLNYDLMCVRERIRQEEQEKINS
jgi:predicted NAD-dependent protein-ADP-ribosyltransferase YbiA (DUF1768 family)